MNIFYFLSSLAESSLAKANTKSTAKNVKILMPISFDSERNRRKKRTKGFTLGTHFQRRAPDARRGNLVRKTDTREGQTTTLTLCVRELIIFSFAKPLLFLGVAFYVNIAKNT